MSNSWRIEADFGLFMAGVGVLGIEGVMVGKEAFLFSRHSPKVVFRMARKMMTKTGEIPRVISERLYAAPGDWLTDHVTDIAPLGVQDVKLPNGRVLWNQTLWLVPEGLNLNPESIQIPWTAIGHRSFPPQGIVIAEKATEVQCPGFAFGLEVQTNFQQEASKKEWAAAAI